MVSFCERDEGVGSSAGCESDREREGSGLVGGAGSAIADDDGPAAGVARDGGADAIRVILDEGDRGI